MTHLQRFIEAIDYRIATNEKYYWECFGDDVRIMDSEEEASGLYGAVFDLYTKELYEITIYLNECTYRWVHEDFRTAHKAECQKHSRLGECDDEKVHHTDCVEDILQKIIDLRAGKKLDGKVVMTLDLPEHVILTAALAAHKLDITLNAYFERALLSVINEHSEGDFWKYDESSD